jgi:hypothetical protein
MSTHYDALIRVRIATGNKAWAERRADELVRCLRLRYETDVSEVELVSVGPAEREEHEHDCNCNDCAAAPHGDLHD